GPVAGEDCETTTHRAVRQARSPCMSNKHEWQQRLIGELRQLADPVKPDRATLAELRRSLNGDLGRALARVGCLFAGLPAYALDDAVLVAALFASHQGPDPGVSLGAAFRELRDKAGSDSVEKRFAALLDTEKEDLGARLRQAVSLLKSKDIALDW